MSFRAKGCRKKSRVMWSSIVVLAALLLAGILLTGPVLSGAPVAAVAPFSTGAAWAGEKYVGTDDLIDKKAQEAAGVSAGKPLIDLNQGNLGLFLFAAGGFAAGVVFGYYWRKIFVEKAGKEG